MAEDWRREWDESLVDARRSLADSQRRGLNTVETEWYRILFAVDKALREAEARAEETLLELSKVHQQLTVESGRLIAAEEAVVLLRSTLDGLNRRLDDISKVGVEAVVERDELRRDLVVNANLLARQCDLAREAETERDALRAWQARVRELAGPSLLALGVD